MLFSRSGSVSSSLSGKSSGAAAVVSDAAERVRAHAVGVSKNAIPLVVVPYMGEVGRERCEQAGVQWLDLSGNARIVAPGVHILVVGRPNRFKPRGRPSTAFAPKASRITRWLLIHNHRCLTQREIALATDMDEGYTSRVVGRLEDDKLVIRDKKGAIRARDPNLLAGCVAGGVRFREASRSTRSCRRAIRRRSPRGTRRDSERERSGPCRLWTRGRLAHKPFRRLSPCDVLHARATLGGFAR